MDYHNIITVIGGLAFFLFGMNVLSSALKKVAGEKLEGILQKMTDHPLKGLVLGAVITIAMQSSSALTVMLVGLVNSGIMSLGQTVGIIMGSNVGTTLTAWILSLSGVETDNVLLAMMKPSNFSPILAFFGVILIMGAKKQRLKDIGTVLVGFSILMQGMDLMSGALAPLASVPEFTSILTAFKNPFLGVVIGMLFTGVIQSSAASVGVLQALSMTGHITYAVAIPIIMGQNIGTCVTALLSSIGVSKNAKRVSVIHVSFNLIGTAIGLIVYLFSAWGLRLEILNETITPVAIAVFHSIFNIATTVILLPFSNVLVTIAKRTIKDDSIEKAFLDERLLMTPSIAVGECRRKTVMILEKSVSGFKTAMSMLNNYDNSKRDEVENMEADVDEKIEICNAFLIQLSESEVSKNESIIIADMLHDLGDMERICDYALSLTKTIRRIHRNGFTKGAELKNQLNPMNQELNNILDGVLHVYESMDADAAKEVIGRSDRLIKDSRKTKKTNLKSLRAGNVGAESSVYLSDYLTVCRRVAEHCENIAESSLGLESSDVRLTHMPLIASLGFGSYGVRLTRMPSIEAQQTE